MPAFAWKPEYCVNIKVIDEQHKKLVSTINILYDAIIKARHSPALAEIFNNLAEYTTDHFATEEDFMTKFSYSDYAEHKYEHDKFIYNIDEFKKKFETGQANLPVEMAIFLVNWLNDHLLKMDHKYKAFFNEKGLV